MNIEKVEIYFCFITLNEIIKIAEKMKKCDMESEKFSKKIFINTELQLLIESGRKGDHHTKIRKEGKELILTTNTLEFSRIASKIKRRVAPTYFGESMAVAVYRCENIMLRIVAKK